MSISILSGSLSIRERIAIPPGAIVTIKMVTRDGDVLAATAIKAESTPIAFDLPVDSEILKTAKKVHVWALLRTEAGAWGTLEISELPHDGTPIILSRIAD